LLYRYLGGKERKKDLTRDWLAKVEVKKMEGGVRGFTSEESEAEGIWPAKVK